MFRTQLRVNCTIQLCTVTLIFGDEGINRKVSEYTLQFVRSGLYFYSKPSFLEVRCYELVVCDSTVSTIAKNGDLYARLI